MAKSTNNEFHESTRVVFLAATYQLLLYVSVDSLSLKLPHFKAENSSTDYIDNMGAMEEKTKMPGNSPGIQETELEFTSPSSTAKNVCSITKLCPTLCDPTDCSPPGSSVHGISQARILEWVAISSSRGFPGGSGRESPGNTGDTGDMGLIPGSGGSPGGGIAKNGWYHKRNTRNTAFSTSDWSLKRAAKWP